MHHVVQACYVPFARVCVHISPTRQRHEIVSPSRTLNTPDTIIRVDYWDRFQPLTYDLSPTRQRHEVMLEPDYCPRVMSSHDNTSSEQHAR